MSEDILNGAPGVRRLIGHVDRHTMRRRGSKEWSDILQSIRERWPEILLEGVEVALLMVGICLAGTLVEWPSSPVRQAVHDPLMRRALLAILVGVTIVGIVHSPLGKRTGAHFNPAVTIGFLRLGRIRPWDAAFYVAAQSLGGILGVAACAALLGGRLAAPEIGYLVTLPGAGEGVAFALEAAMTFALMLVILVVSQRALTAPFTGSAVAVLVTLLIVVEAPYSGASLNPARTLGSAAGAGVWAGLWIYLSAPTLGALLAAEVYHRSRGPCVGCCKLDHDCCKPCIHCGLVKGPLVERTAGTP